MKTYSSPNTRANQCRPMTIICGSAPTPKLSSNLELKLAEEAHDAGSAR